MPEMTPAMTRLRPGFTFGSFHAGAANQSALNQVRSFTSNLFDGSCARLQIVGRSGLGKTHVLHALAHEIRLVSPLLKVGLIESNELLRTLVDQVPQVERATVIESLNFDVILLDHYEEDRRKPTAWSALNEMTEHLVARGVGVVTASRAVRADGWPCAYLRAPDLHARQDVAAQFAVDHDLEQWAGTFVHAAVPLIPSVGQLIGRLHLLRSSLRSRCDPPPQGAQALTRQEATDH